MFISDLVAATVDTIRSTKDSTNGFQQDVVNSTHLMPMIPTDGVWIIAPPEGCIIQHNHVGKKGMRLMDPATWSGQSSQIRTNG